jgi:hypothetical protein
LWLVFFLGCLDENTCKSLLITNADLHSDIPTLHNKPVYTPPHKPTLINKIYTAKPRFQVPAFVFSELLCRFCIVPAKCPSEWYIPDITPSKMLCRF